MNYFGNACSLGFILFSFLYFSGRANHLGVAFHGFTLLKPFRILYKSFEGGEKMETIGCDIASFVTKIFLSPQNTPASAYGSF